MNRILLSIIFVFSATCLLSLDNEKQAEVNYFINSCQFYKAINICKTELKTNSISKGFYYHTIALAYHHLTNKDSLEKYYLLAQEFYEETKEYEKKIETDLNYASALRLFGRIDESVELTLNALNDYKKHKIDNPQLLSNVYVLLLSSYYPFAKAKIEPTDAKWQQLLNSDRKTDTALYINNLLFYANYLTTINSKVEAKSILEKCTKLIESISTENYLIRLEYNSSYAIYYRYNNKISNAKEYMFNSLVLTDSIPIKKKINIDIELSRLYYAEKNYDSALFYLEDALLICPNYMYYDLSLIHKLSANMYIEKKMYEQACNHLIEYIRLNDKAFEKTKTKKMLTLEKDNEISNQKMYLKLLQKDNELKEVKIKYNYFLVIGLIISLILLITLLVLLINRHKKQKEANLIKQKLINSELEKSKIQANESKLLAKELESTLLLNQEKLNNYTKQIIEKTELLDKMQQQLKESSFIEKEEKNVQELLKTIQEYANPNEYWEEFITTFNLVHTNFFNKISAEYPDLTRTELRLCALIKCSLGNKEIANVLNIGHNTVKTACNRLGKKMKLKENENLRQFIHTMK